MTLVSNHIFPRHSHDQFGVGVIDFGAQHSWSGIGRVDASAGDIIMVNPGEMHDGEPTAVRPYLPSMELHWSDADTPDAERVS